MDYAKISEAGSRSKNEDCVRCEIEEERALFVLADGLGGHGEGALASQTVCEMAVSVWKNNNDEDPERLLASIFDFAQEKLLSVQQEKGIPGKAKTTLVVFMTDNNSCLWGHIGDSRLYAFTGNKILERTLDHSVPQMLVNSGELKEKKIRGHEDRSTLLRAMGTPWDSPRYEIKKPKPLRKGDTFLLCSDGFWELIVEKQMEKTLKKADDMYTWLLAMEKIVKEAGRGKNMDNYSAITVRI